MPQEASKAEDDLHVELCCSATLLGIPDVTGGDHLWGFFILRHEHVQLLQALVRYGRASK